MDSRLFVHVKWNVMKWTPPNIKMINPISKRFTTNRRFTSDELPTWVEQSQDIVLRSTVSFLIVTYSATFLSFNHLSNWFLPCPLLTLSIYALHAGSLFVTDTLSTPTITEPPSVERQDLFIPTRSNACVARVDLGRVDQSPIRTILFGTIFFRTMCSILPRHLNVYCTGHFNFSPSFLLLLFIKMKSRKTW